SLIRFHPVLPFLSANLHCLILCRPFATYRRATPSAGGSPGAVGVRMRWCGASTTLRDLFTGRKAAPNSFCGAESILVVLMTLGKCMGETLLLLSCGAAFLTGLGIAAVSLFS